MKKQRYIATAATVAFCLLSTSAFAYNLWVTAKNDEVLKADIIYGHQFPRAQEIAKKRLNSFEPVQVFGTDYMETLTNKGKNYHYENKSFLSNGTYIVKAYYKPTPWSQKSDGKWEMAKTRKDIDSEVKSCSVYSKLAKAIVSVGVDDGIYAMQPLGTHLEITPMVKAGDITFGELVKFKITRDGKAVQHAVIIGNYQGYSEYQDLSAPFYAESNLKGEFWFRPLHRGLWYLHSTVESETGNADCEKRSEETSLSFYVR